MLVLQNRMPEITLVDREPCTGEKHLRARFTGADGRRRLVAALQDQWLLRNDTALAELFADHVTLDELSPGTALMEQGAADNDVAFVLVGQVDVVVNGRPVATRRAGQHVGEMALIDTAARRAATVIARESCVVARITEPDFTALAHGRPELWRHLAQELATRLRQRNTLVAERNTIPHVFVGSSSEQYAVADALAKGVASPTVDVATWKMGVFGPSGYTMDSLEAEAGRSDFAILVLGADDRVRSRKRRSFAPRDNVILELGLFIGHCGRERVFLLTPSGLDVKIPTDMLGISALRFAPAARRTPLDVKDAVGELAQTIHQMGPR